MMQTLSYGWDDIREQLEHDIEVWYVKDENVNREREKDKDRTIRWIIERMKMGSQLGGTRVRAPDYTHTFGGLWEPVSKAMRMRYPMCMCCKERNTVEIHHIRPRFLRGSEVDPCNLIALCVECHDEVHRRLDEGITRAIEEAVHIEPGDFFRSSAEKGIEDYFEERKPLIDQDVGNARRVSSDVFHLLDKKG